MLSVVFVLFIAGLLTILLPCILPLVPIVVGASIANRNRWQPLVTVAGMLVSFVASTFLLNVLLHQFVELADIIRIATYDVLLLFGFGFLFQKRPTLWVGAVIGALFFLEKGITAVVVAAIANIVAVEAGGNVASGLQQAGATLQGETRSSFGDQSLLTAFIIGITLGLVWVPCAGPALSFALALVRNQPGLQAALSLTAYAVGAGIPLLVIGYGGQKAVQSVRALSPYTGRVKEIAGVLLIASALLFQFNLFQRMQTWFVENTGFGTLGNRIEEHLIGNSIRPTSSSSSSSLSSLPSSSSSSLPRLQKNSSESSVSLASSMSPVPSNLPILGQAPDDFAGNGPWHNAASLHLADLRGKVVLIDFWTYSCINCIRTLPYEKATWQRFKDQPFVLIGVHTPEFTFEKSVSNVDMAIKEHGLTYPVFQDNDYATWNAFNNQYWPAKYLIDAKGNIRYTHFGEGAYEETDRNIASLLAEMGHATASNVSLPESQRRSNRDITRETYLHSRSWSAFGNAAGAPDAIAHSYALPQTLQLHTFYLEGTWQLVDDERQVLMNDTGKIAILALAGEVNLILGLEEGAAPVLADVTVDGKLFKHFTIDHHDLYTLFTGDYGTHDIVLTLYGKGASAYAYTFGG